MRYQHARVVLAACLTAAAAAAQAPSTFEGFQFVLAPREQPRAEAATPKADPASFRTADADRWSNLFQDQVDYSQRGLFLQAHGDFINGMERYEPMVSLRAMHLPNQRINHEPGSFDVLGYGADANLPWMISPDGYLMFGAYYEGRRYQFSSATTLDDEVLHAGGVKLGFGGFLDSNTLLEVETRPGIFSDADAGLHHKDFDFPSHLLVTYRAVENFYLKLGVRYNQVYEDAPWLPYLGFSWDITGNSAASSSETYGGSWRIDLLLPEHLEVSYWSSGSTGWMWGVDVTGAEYHGRTSQALGNSEYDVRIQEVVTYLGMTHRLSENFSLGGRVGAVLAGDYDLWDGTGQRIEGALDQGFFASFTMGFDW